MGLFDILKSGNSKSNQTSDDLRLDIEKLLSSSTSYESMTDVEKYICRLEKNIFGLFDSLIIIINSKEKKITENDMVSITLANSNKSYTITQAAIVVNSVAKICKVVDDNWRDIDAFNIKQENWRGRTFIDINGASIFIELDDDLGFTLTITNYPKFIQVL